MRDREAGGKFRKARWRPMLTLIWALAAVYFGLLAVLFVFQRQLIYVPDARRADLATVGAVELMEAGSLTAADGMSTVSWYRAPASPGRPVLVLFQGNAGNIGDRLYKVATFIQKGWGVMLVGYRGYGGNAGKPTEAGLYADARAALRFLQELGVRPERRVLYGESLGSGVATEMALETKACALILEAPFTSIADMAQRRFPFFPARWLVLDRFDTIGKIGRVGVPVLVLHGERDVVTPVDLGRRVYEAAKEPKRLRVFPEAGHVDVFDHGADRAVAEFVEEAMAEELSHTPRHPAE